MKRFFILIISSVLIAFSAFSAYASEAVSFSCNNIESDSNRLFYVEVKAKSTDTISAATFEFTYDSSVLEFRGVSTDDGSIIRANELDDSVKAVYLCSGGKNIQNEAVLFKIQFKAVNSGSCYVNYTVSDCVSGNLENMPVGACSSAFVTVKGSSDSLLQSSSGGGRGSNAGGENYTGKSSQTSATSVTAASYDEFGLLSPDIADNTTFMLIVGIICGAVLIILLILAFLAGKRISEKKNKTENEID